MNAMKDRIGHLGGRNPDALQFPAIETHLIRSRHVQQTFKIQVMQPGQKRGAAQRFPVVYATDGNYSFEMFKALSYMLQMSELDSPPYILVGIGYPSDSPLAGIKLRVRDFTFPPYPQWGGFTPTPWDDVALMPEDGAKDFYGAEDFRNFIGNELIPFIDEKYATSKGDRTYFGHSGGGFFGLFTLFSRSELFRNYIVSSPGLTYHGVGLGGTRRENDEFALDMARQFIATRPKLPGVKLYMSAGAEEEFEPAVENFRLTSSLARMAKLMKDAAIPGLEVMAEIFPGETHMTAWPIAFTHGVQVTFGTRKVLRTVYY